MPEQVGEKGDSRDASSFASFDSSTGMLVLNITALNLLSPYPVETFALTADLCDPVSDTSGCAEAANDIISFSSLNSL